MKTRKVSLNLSRSSGKTKESFASSSSFLFIFLFLSFGFHFPSQFHMQEYILLLHLAGSLSLELSLKSTFKVFRFQSACVPPPPSSFAVRCCVPKREREGGIPRGAGRSSSQDRAASNSILSVIGSDALSAPLAFSPFLSAVARRQIRWIPPETAAELGRRWKRAANVDGGDAEDARGARAKVWVIRMPKQQLLLD